MAKLTGLFPPPGNIAKTANYVPPTLDPARAAMFQLLNKDGVPSSSSMMPNSNIDASAPGIPANLLKQAKRFYIGNLPLDVSEQSLLQFLESNLRSLSGSTDKSTEYSHLNTSITASSISPSVRIEVTRLWSAEVRMMPPLAMNLMACHFEGSQLKVRRPKEYHMFITSGVLTGNNAGGNNKLLLMNSNLIHQLSIQPSLLSVIQSDSTSIVNRCH